MARATAEASPLRTSARGRSHLPIESKVACERTGCTRRARRCNDETIPEGILPDVTDVCGYTGVRIRTCSMGHGRAVCVMTTYPNTLWRYTLQVTLRHPPVI